MQTQKTPPLTIWPALTPLSIARMIWKRKWIVLGIWLVVAVTTLVTVRKLPAIYKSEALILVDSQKIPEKFVSSTVSTELSDRIATIRQQILSSTRLKKIIEDFDLYSAERKTKFEEEILEKMQSDIVITVDRTWSGGRPGSFRVGYEGPNPQVVAQVANRLANLFIDENLKTRELQAEGTSDFIQNQLDDAKKKLDDLEGALSKYKIEHNGELPQQENYLAGTLSRLQVELEANRDGLNRAQQQRLSAENTLTNLETSVAVIARSAADAGQASAAVAPAAESMPAPRVPRPSDVVQAQLDAAELRYGPTHPDVKRLRSELERLRKDEASRVDTADTTPALVAPAPGPTRPGTVPAPPADLRQLRERLANTRNQIALADQEIASRQAEEGRVLKEISANQAHISRLPIREQEMLQVTRDYEITKQNYRALLDKKLAAEMSADMERRQKSERFTVLDAARVPEKPFKPNRDLLNGGGLALGFVLALATGLGLELKRNVLLGEWELPKDVVILGRLPYIAVPALVSGGTGFRGGRAATSLRFRIGLISTALVSVMLVLGAVYYLILHRP